MTDPIHAMARAMSGDTKEDEIRRFMATLQADVALQERVLLLLLTLSVDGFADDETIIEADDLVLRLVHQ